MIAPSLASFPLPAPLIVTARIPKWFGESGLLADILTQPDGSWQSRRAHPYGTNPVCIDYWVGRYMHEHRTFPAPIVALDNRAGTMGGEPAQPRSALAGVQCAMPTACYRSPARCCAG